MEQRACGQRPQAPVGERSLTFSLAFCLRTARRSLAGGVFSCLRRPQEHVVAGSLQVSVDPVDGLGLPKGAHPKISKSLLDRPDRSGYEPAYSLHDRLFSRSGNSWPASAHDQARRARR